MARKTGLVRRGNQMRRETVWFGGGLAVTGVGTGTSVLLASLNAAALALRPFTVVRTRGLLHARSDQIIAAENYDVSYGMAVVSDQAIAAGVASIPTPLTEQATDYWFVYEQIFGRLEFSTAAAYIEAGHERILDSKAARRVDIGQDIAIVAEGSAGSGGVNLTDSFRMLVKLH